jgi:hypothetical protein
MITLAIMGWNVRTKSFHRDSLSVLKHARNNS